MTFRTRHVLAGGLAATGLLATAALPGVSSPSAAGTAGPAPTATATPTPTPSPTVAWQPCTGAAAYDCAHVRVPKDYSRPDAGTFRLAVARLPARDQEHRIGSLFVNFGGPGGSGVQTLVSNGTRLFQRLNQRFDIVSFDPRGVGQSTPAIDCRVNQERSGPFGQPFGTPRNLHPRQLVAADEHYLQRCRRLNPGVLPYVSTANVARDMDRLRQAVGDRRLSYLGLSYGSYLGATYGAMFPDSYRALALEGPVDPVQYARDPIAVMAATSAALERAKGRFLQDCAAHPGGCSGFGHGEPGAALDRLVDRLDDRPLEVGARRLDGDDVRVALATGLHSAHTWGDLGSALVAAQQGDGAPLRLLADYYYGRLDDGSYRPSLDAFFAITAADQRNPDGLRPYLRAGRQSWHAFPHGYWLSGYTTHLWGADRVRARDVMRGPFTLPESSPTALVVGTTYDPASPYEGAQAMVRALGDARLLTLVGDGHGAYGGESACIDSGVNRYLLSGALPPAGTRCHPDK